MKKRIQMDSAILSLIIIVTAVAFFFGKRYVPNPFLDNILDFFGILTILVGTYIRMTSRGYKKACSSDGKELVMDGPYALVRNPMYLGTFLMGCGFVLIFWPWWITPVFAVLFYLRFRRQINKEEAHLKSLFGKDYQAYLQKVPAMFPSFEKLRKIKMNQTFPWKDAWSTKEKYALYGWPLAAFVLEIIKERLSEGRFDFSETVSIFMLAILVFAMSLFWEYSRA